MTDFTTNDQFSMLIEHLRKAQESANMLAHLTRDGYGLARHQSRGWLAVGEQLGNMVILVTKLATGKLQ